MIAKKFKLPIDQFLKNHKVVFRGDFFSCRMAPNSENHNRLGANFKSKSFKTAVSRNRLKRTVFDFFRTHSSFFKNNTSKSGIDLLITLNPAILNLTSEEIQKQLAQLKNHASYN